MPNNFIDLKVPVAYGHISVKVWGTLNHESVNCLALHGWMDSAGTFDRLVPLLSDKFYVVAVDLPGHGFSSHLPQGCPYVDQTWSISLKKIIDYFKFKKVTLMGHSMGASISFWFASMFPDLVERIISLDQVCPRVFAPKDIAKEMANSVKSFIELDKKIHDKPAVFRFESAIKVLIVAHSSGKIDREGALCLLKRATKTSPDGDGIVFTRDNRLNAMLTNKTDVDTLKNYYRNMSCEMLMIIGKGGNIDLLNTGIREVIDAHKMNCKNFKLVQVQGDHYVHLTAPENISKTINEFVQSNDLSKKLESTSIS